MKPRYYRTTLVIKNPDICLERQAGAHRFIFNWALARVKEHHGATGVFPTYGQLAKELTLRKQGKWVYKPIDTPLKEMNTVWGTTIREWLNACDSVGLQQALRDVYASVNMSIKRRKRLPTFKKAKTAKLVFRVSGNVRIDLKSFTIKLGKVGTYNFTMKGKEIQGDVVSATTYKDTRGRWCVSLCIHGQAEAIKKTGRSCAIDLGARIFATIITNRGKLIEIKRPKREAVQKEKMRKHFEAMLRCVKGSNRHKKKIAVLDKAREKWVNQKKDFNHKLSSKLVAKFDTVYVEDLDMAKFMRTKYVAKYFQDTATSQFVRMLEYKLDWSDGDLIKVDPAYTSKMCSCCGGINKSMRKPRKTKFHRYWVCAFCGEELERDANAATNIFNLGKLAKSASDRPSLSNSKTYRRLLKCEKLPGSSHYPTSRQTRGSRHG